MSIRIITDSASDILQREAGEMGIIVLPLSISFDGTEYLDGVTISSREFYEKLIECDALPKTSQAGPEAFMEAYKKVLKEGDTPLVITLSGSLSGTYQSANIAAQELGADITIVDSENVSLGEKCLILRAMELIRKGMSVQEIAEVLEKEKKQIRLIAVLDTLEYLKKGGRISAAAAFAGTVLSIKPVIAIENGVVVIKGKARGSKNANNQLRQLIASSNGVDFERPYYTAYSGTDDMMLQKYLEDNGDLWKHSSREIPAMVVGSTIGTHVGPGAIAVTFFERS